jgi:hypothetical protein
MDGMALLVAALAIGLASLYYVFRAVAWLFGSGSGWRSLEQSFACDVDERVWTHRAETIRVGRVRFRHCVSAGIQPDALYLRTMAIFRFRAIRVPWERMSGFQPDSIYSRKAMRFSVGSTPVAVELPLYKAMYPHVSRAFAQTAGSTRTGDS